MNLKRKKVFIVKIIINTKHLTITKGRFNFMLYDSKNKHIGICIGKGGIHMIKIKRAPISFIYNKPNTKHYLVCVAPGDDMIKIFRYAYNYIQCDLEYKKS